MNSNKSNLALRRLLKFSLAIVLVTCAGCGSKAVIPGGTVTLEQVGTKTELATGSSGLTLPDDFPDDMPVYPNAKIVMVTNHPAMAVVAAESMDSIEQVFAYYEKELAAQGWEVSGTMKTEKGGNISAKKESRVGTITIGQKNKTGETVLNIMLQTLPSL